MLPHYYSLCFQGRAIGPQRERGSFVRVSEAKLYVPPFYPEQLITDNPLLANSNILDRLYKY